jgi:hypothetical protein
MQTNLPSVHFVKHDSCVRTEFLHFTKIVFVFAVNVNKGKLDGVRPLPAKDGFITQPRMLVYQSVFITSEGIRIFVSWRNVFEVYQQFLLCEKGIQFEISRSKFYSSYQIWV